MAIRYADLATQSGDTMDADFFNKRFQLIVNEINAAEELASQYANISNELLSLGLEQVNASLGPLVAELSAAATTGFLVTTSTTSLTLTTGDQANFTVPTVSSGLFEPTPFLSVQLNSDSTQWATGQLASWNPNTGALSIGITQTSTGSPITGGGWTIAAGSATLPAAVAAETAAVAAAATATAAAATATTQAGIATSDAAALTALVSSAGVASIAGLSGIVTASAAKTALAISHSDITDASTAFVNSVAGLTGTVSAGGLKSALAITSSDVSGLLALSSTTPLADGTASAGSASTAARADHVHPSTSTLVSPVWFGAGSDGNVTISSGTTTLTRDMYYNNLTLSGTGKLHPNGFRIFVAGTLDLTAAGANAIAMNGSNAPGVLSASGFLTGSSPGATYCLGGLGGVSGSANPTCTTALIPETFLQMVPYSGTAVGVSGGGDGANGPGLTNAGGSGAGLIFIAANTINRGVSSAAGALSVVGGQGGNAPTTDFGAGGGGGGRVYIIVGQLTGVSASSLITAAGGQAGNGNGHLGGNGGNGGNITIINLSANSVAVVIGSAGSAPSGSAGGAGGACAASL
jgi:hypothetical protein